MELGLKGKKALVLGASRGLGAACAKELAQEGVEVYAAARSAFDRSEVSGGGQIIPRSFDMANPEEVTRLGAEMAEIGIDILINNSGGPAAGPAKGQNPAAWSRAFEMMALPIMQLTDALVPSMVKRGFGRIITIGSSGIIAPIPGLALSNGVRGVLAGWSKTLAAEVAASGVTVNMVLPGRLDTDRVRELDENKAGATGQSVDAVAAASRATIPAGRYGRPEELAAVVAFLASERSSYVTGSMIRVDGGMLRNL
jgi:3-oxoacyl-[acyl-carrier protein] reductase